jgi:hypothetical protein
MGSSSRDYCHELFKNLEVLPLLSQYMFSLLLFKNRELFISYSDEHNINTRYNSDLHLPTANLAAFQREFLFLN